MIAHEIANRRAAVEWGGTHGSGWKPERAHHQRPPHGNIFLEDVSQRMLLVEIYS